MIGVAPESLWMLAFDSILLILEANMTIVIDTKTLREKRSQRHWSQSDLSEASGLSLRTVQRMETEGRCSIDSIQAIAAAFDLSVDEFLISHQNIGIKRGVTMGFIGVAVGSLAAITSVLLGIQSEAGAFSNAGISFGIIGAIAGLSCAFIGAMSTRMKST